MKLFIVKMANTAALTSLSFVCLGSLNLSWGAEKYAAMVEDGTAHIVQSSTPEPIVPAAIKNEPTVIAPSKPVTDAPTANTSEHVVNSKAATDEYLTEEHITRKLVRPKADEVSELRKRIEVLEETKTQLLAAQRKEAPAPSVLTNSVQPLALTAAPTPAPTPTPTPAAVVVATPAAMTAAIATPVINHSLPATPAKAEKFDIVPDSRVSEVAQRLKYTNEILKRFGRAYDYRTTTLKEFKKALAELEKSEEKTKSQN